MTDNDYMNIALTLAAKGRGKTSPNPMVGCVIVKNNKIVAQSWHRRAGQDHAEVVALKKAGHRAQDAKLYVTLEPCFHFGRTPPCVDPIISCGIKEVIIAMVDPNPLTNGKSIAKLKKAGIKVKVGVLQKEAELLNEIFIKYIKNKMPFVVGKSAQTLDGKIATVSGDSKWITSQISRAFSHTMRNEFDAILVGINTVLRDNPYLNADDKTKRIKKIVLDPFLKISPRANVFKGTLSRNCILVTTSNASLNKIKTFEKRGIKVIVFPKHLSDIDLKWLFKELAKQQITSILIEGGAKTLGRALKQEVVDKMHVFLAPKIIGDQNAISSIDGLSIFKISKAIEFKRLTYQKIGSDLFITGYVHRNR